jgi:hypothetical protein
LVSDIPAGDGKIANLFFAGTKQTSDTHYPHYFNKEKELRKNFFLILLKVKVDDIRHCNWYVKSFTAHTAISLFTNPQSYEALGSNPDASRKSINGPVRKNKVKIISDPIIYSFSFSLG